MNIDRAKKDFLIKNDTLYIEFPLISLHFSDVEKAESSVKNENGLSEPYIEITAEGGGRIRHYCLWEDLPIVYMPDYSEKTLFHLQGEHWIIKTVKLHAFTDENDTLTEENEYYLFGGQLFGEKQGEIFFLQNIESCKSIVIISETPDYEKTKLYIKKGAVTVENGGNGLALGFCDNGECDALCRNYYRHANKNHGLVSMSNTWGDMNGTSRVCEEFILKEIDAAKDIGVDIVQIDDGWQTGNTYDPARRNELGRRNFSGEFWSIDRKRFPNGMKEISDYAAKKNIKVGLWFAPDSNNNFALIERDKEVLRQAYDEWGFRFFKLDMFWITSIAERNKILELLQYIYSLGDDVAVQLDVTRNERLNYLCGKQYGTVFVENRYTRSVNSFPHRVLRNLWMISKYLPASKFQFELVNPDLFKEYYNSDDPFAPNLYDMDYLFATVMLSNPLFWMEIQFLQKNRRDELQRIINVWKNVREELSKADVIPIGDKPSGRNFTGFAVAVNGKPRYLLLFREVTDNAATVFITPWEISSTEILASNAKVTLSKAERGIRADFSKPRAYAFIKVTTNSDENAKNM